MGDKNTSNEVGRGFTGSIMAYRADLIGTYSIKKAILEAFTIGVSGIKLYTRRLSAPQFLDNNL